MALLNSVSFVMLEVEYLRSYPEAVPMLLSSPGAVQERSTEVWVMLELARFVMFAGGVMSGVEAWVVWKVWSVDWEVLLASSVEVIL